MPRYVIEREVPGAGTLTSEELQEISNKSCSVIDELGPQIRWLQSYVTENKIYCVYEAPNKAVIMLHADMGGFPANRIEKIENLISPVNAGRMSAKI